MNSKKPKTSPAAAGSHEEPPVFDAAFGDKLHDLFLWRRDVRRFRNDPVAESLIADLVAEAAHAPSVGHAQPWRFVRVDDPSRRAAVRADFESCNAAALGDYEGERARLYATLKLSGFDAAPVHLAVFCDEGTGNGQGLGRKTMPETLAYSCVMAVYTLWLSARAQGLGVGWVSILEPENIKRALDVPESWSLIAYLCIGYPLEEHKDPELDRFGWQPRDEKTSLILKR